MLLDAAIIGCGSDYHLTYTFTSVVHVTLNSLTDEKIEQPPPMDVILTPHEPMDVIFDT